MFDLAAVLIVGGIGNQCNVDECRHLADSSHYRFAISLLTEKSITPLNQTHDRLVRYIDSPPQYLRLREYAADALLLAGCFCVASLLLKKKEKRVHAVAAFLRITQFHRG